MDDEDLAATPAANRADEVADEFVALVTIDADSVLDCDRKGDCFAHRPDAVGDEPGLGHQAGAEGAALDPLARAAAVEVDLVVTPALAEPRAGGERRRVAAPKLERQRMFCRIEIEVAPRIAVPQGARPDRLADAAPCLAHVAGEKVSVVRQGERHGQRAIAGEDADLDGTARPDESRQKPEELPLVGADLHACIRERFRRLAQAGLRRMLANSAS